MPNLIEEYLTFIALAGMVAGALCILYAPYRLSLEAWRWMKESWGTATIGPLKLASNAAASKKRPVPLQESFYGP